MLRPQLNFQPGSGFRNRFPQTVASPEKNITIVPQTPLGTIAHKAQSSMEKDLTWRLPKNKTLALEIGYRNRLH